MGQGVYRFLERPIRFLVFISEAEGLLFLLRHSRAPSILWNVEERMALVLAQSPPEKCDQVDVYRERDIYFKELAYVIVEAGKSEICRVGHRLETQGRATVGV